MVKITLPMVTLAASIAFPSGAAGIVIYYLDHEYARQVQGGYLTITEYKLAGAETNVQRLQEQVDSLQWDLDNGQATDKDKWLLEQKKKQLLEWQGKISKLKQGRPVI